ncbi:hypothetical protein [Chryseobacterium defluvii]|uniref:Apea-like HEPN domain-containing protein n=1 Tax=Chryseobacterium defluvii TaxID=160396 RepID=A0A495SAS6_9FLAO|nr:hypothetical protein [Chryseobacterium defluvii]RKS97352.1 hypothetical protein BCF58_1474 [Chryseobacterium defluvii]
MSNPYIENADRWLSIAEVDYLTLFVKAWIPFNAWYRNSYPLLKTDKAAIDEIKSNPNVFRDKIISIINSAETENIIIKGYISDLHRILENNYIPNSLNRVSFHKLVLERNPIQVKIEVKYSWTYKVELIYTGFSNYNISVIITDGNGSTKYTYSQNKYDVDDLERNINTTSLTSKQKEYLKKIYLEINPKKEISLITDKREYISISGTKFINDDLKISKGVIEILYKLRCILFHGELNPTKENQAAYKPAFYILKFLIQSLR